VTLRPPDIVFEDLRIDLGGQTVESTGRPANTPGDTITYVPGARAAWTGNMTGGSFGLALESDAPTYLGTLTRFIRTLEIETLVPAHAPILGPSDLWLYLVYFSQLTQDIKKALGASWTLEETLQRTPMGEASGFPSTRGPLMEGRHRYNVRRTYLLAGQTGGRRRPTAGSRRGLRRVRGAGIPGVSAGNACPPQFSCSASGRAPGAAPSQPSRAARRGGGGLARCGRTLHPAP
jgi:cyclase